MQSDLSDSSLFNHKSVMTDEILVSINKYPLISGNKLTGIDATLGGGGHSYQLLKKYPDLKIIGLCLLYTSPSPRDLSTSRMPSSA